MPDQGNVLVMGFSWIMQNFEQFSRFVGRPNRKIVLNHNQNR